MTISNNDRSDRAALGRILGTVLAARDTALGAPSPVWSQIYAYALDEIGGICQLQLGVVTPSPPPVAEVQLPEPDES